MSDEKETSLGHTPKGVCLMRIAFIVPVLLSSLCFSQQSKPQSGVNEIPPEAIPAGTCTQSNSGYLGIVEKDKTERTKLSDKEIGEYVRKNLAEGYSVTLYPQASGKIFTIQICRPMNPTAAGSR
jgi:hypothetical protein